MTRESWRLVLDPLPSRGAWNMAVDEALLESCGSGATPPTLRLYAWDPPCITLGYAQPFQDVDLVRLETLGWELVRRPTGGKAVLHTDELTYSINARHDEPHVAGTVLESYNRLAVALVEALRLLDLDADIQQRTDTSGIDKTNPVCFEVPSAYEITVGGKKLIGSAQARRKDGVLQHGSLPLSGDLTRILRVLSFPDEASRQRSAARLLAHATTLETELGKAVSWETAMQAFVSAFGSILEIDLVLAEITPEEKLRARSLVENKYGQVEWTRRTS